MVSLMTDKSGKLECEVLFLSGGLQLSGSTTWMNSLIMAFENAGVATAHLVTSIETEVKSAASKVYYTNRARKHLPNRILRLLQLHKVLPNYYARKENEYFNNYVRQLLSKNNKKILVLKDFNSYLPSYFEKEQFVVDVMHNHFAAYETGYYRDRLISVSKSVKDKACELGFKVDDVIYNPLDIANLRIKSIEYEVEEDNFILYVGRLRKDKGVRHLIEAYQSLLKEEKIKHKLIFLGHGSEMEALRKYADENKISEYVVFKGFLSNPYPYIKNAKLLVLPSYSEAMPYVAIEAAALNTSYLVSNFSGSSEFFPKENIFSMCKDSESFNENLKIKIIKLLEAPTSSLKSGLDKKIAPEKVAESYYKLLHNSKVRDDW